MPDVQLASVQERLEVGGCRAFLRPHIANIGCFVPSGSVGQNALGLSGRIEAVGGFHPLGYTGVT